MKRILACGLAGVMALAPLAGCETLTAATGGPSSSATCAPVSPDLDYARLRPEPRLLAEAVERANTGHIEVRRKAGVPAENIRGDYIRIFTWGSFLPGRYSTVARRLGDVWSIERVSEGRDDRGGRLPPEAPSVQRFILSNDKAAELDRLLADRCLYQEPTYYGRTVPTVGGGEATCADGADYLIEIEVAGRTHRSFHACQSWGRPGAVAGLLWEALQGASE